MDGSSPPSGYHLLDPILATAVVGGSVALGFTLLGAAVTGLVKSHFTLMGDVAGLKRDIPALRQEILGRMDLQEVVYERRNRVLETRSAEAFLEPNPITPVELEYFRKSRQVGAENMDDEELLGAIEALDRELDFNHIKPEKRGDAIRLLATYNGKLEERAGKRALGMGTDELIDAIADLEAALTLRTIPHRRRPWTERLLGIYRVALVQKTANAEQREPEMAHPSVLRTLWPF